MTYGIWKPVILLPKNTDWRDEPRLRYVLAHEITHIRRFDILLKWLLAAAVCVHWFNPLVWVMYILANRDIELSCDEAVVRTFGETAKSAYALTLIGLEERKSGFSPLCNNFAKNAIEERIESIMKIKKKTFAGMAAAGVLTLSLALGMLATSAYNDAPSGGEAAKPDETISAGCDGACLVSGTECKPDLDTVDAWSKEDMVLYSRAEWCRLNRVAADYGFPELDLSDEDKVRLARGEIDFPEDYLAALKASPGYSALTPENAQGGFVDYDVYDADGKYVESGSVLFTAREGEGGTRLIPSLPVTIPAGSSYVFRPSMTVAKGWHTASGYWFCFSYELSAPRTVAAELRNTTGGLPGTAVSTYPSQTRIKNALGYEVASTGDYAFTLFNNGGSSATVTMVEFWMTNNYAQASAWWAARRS
ncbi:MAG: M56 family metallopeptidase, partial [Oscillospiraceae bacterium]|jgi:hypothetical protein|nr:M56 family metallopeptidase [Oscillospiraceae bacterium]